MSSEKVLQCLRHKTKIEIVVQVGYIHLTERNRFEGAESQGLNQANSRRRIAEICIDSQKHGIKEFGKPGIEALEGGTMSLDDQSPSLMIKISLVYLCQWIYRIRAMSNLNTRADSLINVEELWRYMTSTHDSIRT